MTPGAAEEAARPATPADVPALLALGVELRDHLRAQRGGELWEAHDADPAPDAPALEAALADPGTEVLVGTLDGHPVAYATLHEERLRDGRTLAVVDELVVTEAARGVGVGEALVGAVLDWARARDCLGVDATALPGDRTAKNFFEAAGFTARRLVMHHRL